MAGINKPAVGVAAAVILIAAGTMYYFRTRHAPAAESAAPPAVLAPSPDAEAAIEHPLPAASSGSASAAIPLPDLKESDAPLRDALAKLLGVEGVGRYLRPEDLVRNLVVTIDNLPRQKVALQKRPTLPLAGTLQVDGDEVHATLDPQNYERYKPMVALIDHVDMQQLAQVYIHFYPLFQQSYQNLGYPNGYFNDRLVQVIDSLLATPAPAGPIELARPNVMYAFADPMLEAKPAGQKLLIRMGPENAAIVKNKLSELRAIVTAAPPKK